MIHQAQACHTHEMNLNAWDTIYMFVTIRLILKC